jgi:hypothetical protein
MGAGLTPDSMDRPDGIRHYTRPVDDICHGGTACTCSFKCCGEESCDGSVCKACVESCFNGKPEDDPVYSQSLSICQYQQRSGYTRL